MDYVVVVELRHVREEADALLRMTHENALASVELEPGCLRFDVSVSPERDRVFLYEIYVDEAAFGDHLKTAHFKAFDTASAPKVTAKTVQIFSRIADPAKARAEV